MGAAGCGIAGGCGGGSAAWWDIPTGVELPYSASNWPNAFVQRFAGASLANPQTLIASGVLQVLQSWGFVSSSSGRYPMQPAVASSGAFSTPLLVIASGELRISSSADFATRPFDVAVLYQKP